MLTFTLGTFAIALNHLLLISALALATFVGWRVAKRGGENPESALFSLFLLGMLAARIGFVAVYWAHYHNDPWQIIDLRDGGFLAWPGHGLDDLRGDDRPFDAEFCDSLAANALERETPVRPGLNRGEEEREGKAG